MSSTFRTLYHSLVSIPLSSIMCLFRPRAIVDFSHVVGTLLRTCPRKSQPRSASVGHGTGLVSQALRELGDKINVGLFECAPFSCFDNLPYLIFPFSTHTTHCVVIVFNLYSLGSALIDVALLLYHLQGLMSPKWCSPVTPDFEEKDGWNMFNLLDEVFAYEEAVCGESRTGTYPLLYIGFVCIIDRRCDSSLF